MESVKPEPGGRRWLFTGCAGLAAVLLVCLVTAYRWVADPPPLHCSLPVFPFPEATLFAWSGDSKRLLAGNQRGEVAVVRFPELTVERLPRPADPNLGTAEKVNWDRRQRPLVLWISPS